jgi:hypothetical protein
MSLLLVLASQEGNVFLINILSFDIIVVVLKILTPF